MIVNRLIIETGFIEWKMVDEWKELMKMLPIERDTSLFYARTENMKLWDRCLQRCAFEKRRETVHVMINDKQFTKVQKREKETRGEFPLILQCGVESGERGNKKR